MLKIGIIGAGTVGSALAIRLAESGYSVAAVSSGTCASAEKLAQAIKGCRACTGNQQVADIADFVFITTPDAVIPQIAAGLQWHKGQSVVHCSGADSTAVLEPARKMGAQTGAFHPLQTFANIKQAIANLPGSTFAIEAEEPLLTTLKEMAEKLSCRWIELKAEDKVIYHAAAVIASNYLVTLVKLADDLWETFGIPREQATQALLPLLKGTLNNIETCRHSAGADRTDCPRRYGNRQKTSRRSAKRSPGRTLDLLRTRSADYPHRPGQRQNR